MIAPRPQMPVLKITTIYDNREYDPRLRIGWGFSCLVELGEEKVLFDTGADWLVEKFNLDRLGIDPRQIGTIFLSHAHCDHMGGLTGLLKEARQAKVYLGRSFPQNIKDAVARFGVETVEVTGPQKLREGLYSTGELPGLIAEQSLVLRARTGLILITGCAHPGIVEIVRAVREQLGEAAQMILGGLHLGELPSSEIMEIITELGNSGVEKVAPCHCSGERALELFQEAYGKGFIAIGVGKVIEL